MIEYVNLWKEAYTDKCELMFFTASRRKMLEVENNLDAQENIIKQQFLEQLESQKE